MRKLLAMLAAALIFSLGASGAAYAFKPSKCLRCGNDIHVVHHPVPTPWHHHTGSTSGASHYVWKRWRKGG